MQELKNVQLEYELKQVYRNFKVWMMRLENCVINKLQ